MAGTAGRCFSRWLGIPPQDAHAVDCSPGRPVAGRLQILEHDRQVFFRLPSKAIMGVSRPLASFPRLTVKQDGEDDHGWGIKAEEIRMAIMTLGSAAEKNGQRFWSWPVEIGGRGT